jgi:hypothetical protein
MTSLLGQHSTNPGGSQGLLTALQQLKARADAGDAGARATLQAIAAGGTTRGGSVPGWNETIDWGAADTGAGGRNTGGRAADRALASAVLSGNTNSINAIEANKAATYKPWTGGLIADALPAGAAALGSLVGIPPTVTGAVVGGLEGGLGVTNRKPLAGALLGGAEGAVVGALPGIGHVAAAPAVPGAAPENTVPGLAFRDIANAGVTAAPQPGVLSAIGSYAAKNPDVVKAVVPGVLGAGASIYGSTLMGKAEDQQAAIAQQQANDQSAITQRQLNRVPFAVWKARRDAAAPGGSPTF